MWRPRWFARRSDAASMRLCVLEVELLEDRTLLATLSLAPVVVPAATRAPTVPAALPAAAPAPQNPGPAPAPEGGVRQGEAGAIPARPADAAVNNPVLTAALPTQSGSVALLAPAPGAFLAEDQDQLLNLDSLNRGPTPTDLAAWDRVWLPESTEGQWSPLPPLTDTVVAPVPAAVSVGDHSRAPDSLCVVGLDAGQEPAVTANPDRVAAVLCQYLLVSPWSESDETTLVAPWESGGYADFVMGLDAAVNALPNNPALPVPEMEAPASPE